MKNDKYVIVAILAVVAIIIATTAFFFLHRKKDAYEGGWECKADTERCVRDAGPYNSKADCLRDRKKACGKKAWDCGAGKCHPDPWGGPYDSEPDCLQNSSCGTVPSTAFDPAKVKFTFTPFRNNNSCAGTNCPAGQLNPSFYKMCMIGHLNQEILSNCDQTALVQAIIDNFNCISPGISQTVNLDGTVYEAAGSGWYDQKAYNNYMASLTDKVVRTAAAQGKMMFVFPIIYGTSSLFQLYKSLGNDQGFYFIYNQLTSKFDRNFIKGIIYDFEIWDKYGDGQCPDGPLPQTVAEAKCWDHGDDPAVHSHHMCCLYYYLGSYLNDFAKTWAKHEPGWEIYINTYLDRRMLASDALVTLAGALKNNPNLGIQFQDYFRVDPENNGTVREFIRQVGSASKMIWGFGGTKTGGDVWTSDDLRTTIQKLNELGFYGVFVWAGACFLYANAIIPMSCKNPYPDDPASRVYSDFMSDCGPPQ